MYTVGLRSRLLVSSQTGGSNVLLRGRQRFVITLSSRPGATVAGGDKRDLLLLSSSWRSPADWVLAPPLKRRAVSAASQNRYLGNLTSYDMGQLRIARRHAV